MLSETRNEQRFEAICAGIDQTNVLLRRMLSTLEGKTTILQAPEDRIIVSFTRPYDCDYYAARGFFTDLMNWQLNNKPALTKYVNLHQANWYDRAYNHYCKETGFNIYRHYKYIRSMLISRRLGPLPERKLDIVERLGRMKDLYQLCWRLTQNGVILPYIPHEEGHKEIDITPINELAGTSLIDGPVVGRRRKKKKYIKARLSNTGKKLVQQAEDEQTRRRKIVERAKTQVDAALAEADV